MATLKTAKYEAYAAILFAVVCRGRKANERLSPQ